MEQRKPSAFIFIHNREGRAGHPVRNSKPLGHSGDECCLACTQIAGKGNDLPRLEPFRQPLSQRSGLLHLICCKLHVLTPSHQV